MSRAWWKRKTLEFRLHWFWRLNRLEDHLGVWTAWLDRRREEAAARPDPAAWFNDDEADHRPGVPGGLVVTGPERDRLFRIVCAMMSNGCCPCPPDICDCFGGVPFEARRDIDLYVKDVS